MFIGFLAVVRQRSLRAESPQMIAAASGQSRRVTKSEKPVHLGTVEAMTPVTPRMPRSAPAVMHGGHFGGGKRDKPSGRVPNGQLVRQTAALFKGAPRRCGDDRLPGDHHRGRRRGQPGAHRRRLRLSPLPHTQRRAPSGQRSAARGAGRDHDRDHDRHRGDRRAPDVRHQPRRTARHGGASQPPLRAPAGHVAALLHRHTHRRDSVPAHQRRRRHSVGRHRHRHIPALQHRDAAEHADRDARCSPGS